MVIQALIDAVAPSLSPEQRQEAVNFAVTAMQQTRDAYREPVSLLEVARSGEHVLSFTVRALYTHNISTYDMELGSKSHHPDLLLEASDVK